MPRARVSGLNVYPVKGCRGITVDAARISVRGLVATTAGAMAGDREWMVVGPDNRFVTQRDNPRLALVVPALLDDGLVLAAPGALPLHIPANGSGGTVARDVVVWRDTVPAHDAGDAAARWLSDVLGADVRLVRFDAAHERRCNPVYAGDSGAHTAFADGYPMLVIGESSLDELNGRLVAKGVAAIPMNRFRPNLVLSGLDPYAEDHVGVINARGITLKLVKPCTRCQVPTIDQDTAQAGAEPLATLTGYRSDAALGGVTFGVNAIVVAGAGQTLSTGDVVDCSYAF